MPSDFSLYDLDNDSIYEIVIKFSVPETEAVYSELFKFIDGSYKKIDQSIGFYEFLKDSDNNKLISMESGREYELKVSYLDLENVYNKDTFICNSYIDYINNIVGQLYTEEEITVIENLLREKNEEIKEIPSEDLKNLIKEKINIKNDNYISWKDMYPSFLFNILTDNLFTLYDFDKNGTPELIFSSPILEYNSNIFSYKDGKVVSLDYVIEKNLRDCFLYTYKNINLNKDEIVIVDKNNKTNTSFVYMENDKLNMIPISLEDEDTMSLLKWYENDPYSAIDIMYQQ